MLWKRVKELSSKQFLAELCILIVFLSWGLNYNLIKYCLQYTTPLIFNCLSFGSGFLLLLFLLYDKLRWIDIIPSLFVGLFIFIFSSMQLLALTQTLVAKTAFYATLDIPVTALLELFLRRLEYHEYVGVTCSIFGALLLSWDGNSVSINIGDLYSILACVPSSFYFFSCSLFATSKAKDSICVGQLFVPFVFSGFLSVLVESPQFRLHWKLVVGIVSSGCICSGIAFFLLTWAQMYTTPTRMVIIGAPEPVFAALVAYIFYGEVFESYVNVLGAMLMIIGKCLPSL